MFIFAGSKAPSHLSEDAPLVEHMMQTVGVRELGVPGPQKILSSDAQFRKLPHAPTQSRIKPHKTRYGAAGQAACVTDGLIPFQTVRQINERAHLELLPRSVSGLQSNDRVLAEEIRPHRHPE